MRVGCGQPALNRLRAPGSGYARASAVKAIPPPMLAKPAAHATSRLELRLRAEVGRLPRLPATEHGLRVFSRRRWDMTALLPELERFPVRGVSDGELIAFTDGQPDFVALCDRMLLRQDRGIPIAFVAFDVLSRRAVPAVAARTFARMQTTH